MFRSAYALLAILCVFGLAPAVYAETLTVPDQPKETFSVTLPGRGMPMESVLQQFGEPEEKHEQVGTPPISRWVYKKFTVYFEDSYVIHAVFHSPVK